MAKVSIITASHNSARFLSATLASVISQSYTNWEMIVVDDCSQDASREIVEEFSLKYSGISQICLRRNSGPAVARNTAIEAATGRYIAFLDSDDQWLPEKLSSQIAYMEAESHALTYTHYERITEAGILTGVVVMPPDVLTYKDMLKSNKIGCLTAVYDSSSLGKVYMPHLRKRQDYALWLKILRAGINAHCVPQVLARYRVREGSISSNKLGLLKYNWHLYRHIEGLTKAQSAYYVGCNIGSKIYSKISRRPV